MAITQSYHKYGILPSAVISDGPLAVPLWAVTTLTLTETYQLPPIGSAGARAVVATHDDKIELKGLLVGGERYAWKFALETLAEASKRGTMWASMTGGKVSGLVLITSMTIRTDMQVESLSFTASSAKRDTLDVSITLVHMPLPGAFGKLLDVLSIGVGALSDWRGN